MKPQDYKNLIIKAYTDIKKVDHYAISDEDFNMFCDIARKFESGKSVLEQWKKFLNKGNISIKDFIDWCIDFYMEDGE